MGIIQKIIGGGIANVAEGITSAIDRFVETPDEKQAAKVLKDKMNLEYQKWQMEINKIEAVHRTIFVAGWRPAIGWICALALLWAWVLAPLVEYIAAIAGSNVQLPRVNTEGSLTLVGSLLGVAGLRTVEKVKGVTS